MSTAVRSQRDAIRAMLADLKMPGSLEGVDTFLATSMADVWLQQRRSADCSRRRSACNNRRLQAAIRSSRLPIVKTLESFDFSFQPSIKREQIESLHDTHLAISLAIAAAQRGRRTYYGTLIDLITSLEEAQAAGRLAQRLAVLTHPSLLVVDEIGYLPINHPGAVLFFQLMNRRYEHASTVLTSNKGFEQWGEVFGDDVMEAALVDRVLHHCHLVNIRGNSYGMREHTEL